MFLWIADTRKQVAISTLDLTSMHSSLRFAVILLREIAILQRHSRFFFPSSSEQSVFDNEHLLFWGSFVRLRWGQIVTEALSQIFRTL